MSAVTGRIQHQLSEVETIWEIPNFLSSFVKGKNSLRSPRFRIADSLWFVKVQKNFNEQEIVEAQFRILPCVAGRSLRPPKEVYSSSKIKEIICRNIKILLKGNFYRVYSKERKNYKCWEFEILDYAEDKSALNSCISTVRWRVKVTNSISILEKFTELDTLSEDLESLFSKRINCDVTFRVQNKKFRAHRSILTARSAVFATMFERELLESETGVVYIEDYDPAAFRVFLRYLYTGKAENLTQEKAQHLYKIADKYELIKLKSFCVEFMGQHISASTVSYIAMLAQLYEEKELLDTVQDFFNENVAAVLATKSWEKLLRDDHLLANRLMKDMASTMKIQKIDTSD